MTRKVYEKETPQGLNINSQVINPRTIRRNRNLSAPIPSVSSEKVLEEYYNDQPKPDDTGWLAIDGDWWVNSWEEYSTDYPCMYRIIRGQVFLTGLMKNGSDPANAIEFPGSMAPYGTPHFTVANSAAAYGTLRVMGFSANPSDAGALNAYQLTGNAWVSLYGISWFIEEGLRG